MTTLIKKQRTTILYDVCFIISAIAMGAILWAHPQEKLTIVSFGTYAIGICALVMIVKYVFTYLKKMSISGVLLILLIAVTALAVFFSNDNLKSNIVAAVCFVEIPIFMLCSSELKTKLPAQVFIWVQYVLSFYYLYLSTTDKAYLFRGYYGIIEVEELTLSYNNPNETSMYLICCLLTLLVAVTFYKQIWFKILFIINAAAVFNLIFLTQCRAGIIAATLSVLGLFLHKFVKVKKWFTRLAMFIPVIMVVLIYYFNEQLTEIKLFGEAMDTGRNKVFDQVFNGLKAYEIFTGNFSKHSFDNLHNVYISVFATVGIFGVLLFALFFDRSLNQFKTKINVKSAYQKMAYICVLLLIVYSSVEATIFVGGSAFAMEFISVFTLFALEPEEDKFTRKEDFSCVGDKK